MKNSIRLSIISQSIAPTLLFAGLLSNAHSQTAPPITEEQRRRAAEDAAQQEQLRRSQTEALQRQRQLQAPNVDLQNAASAALHTLTLPSKSPCFTIHQFVLAVPPQLSSAAQLAGASALPFDSFRFAQDFTAIRWRMCRTDRSESDCGKPD